LLHRSGHHLARHSFPTRRSSDLAKAFNAALKRLGGKEQTAPDPVLLDTVNRAKATLTGPGPVIDLAITLEDTAAQTYVANTSARSEEHTSELQSRFDLVCRLLLE